MDTSPPVRIHNDEVPRPRSTHLPPLPGTPISRPESPVRGKEPFNVNLAANTFSSEPNSPDPLLHTPVPRIAVVPPALSLHSPGDFFPVNEGGPAEAGRDSSSLLSPSSVRVDPPPPTTATAVKSRSSSTGSNKKSRIPGLRMLRRSRGSSQKIQDDRTKSDRSSEDQNRINELSDLYDAQAAVHACTMLNKTFGNNNWGRIRFSNFNNAWYVKVPNNIDLSKDLVRFVNETLQYPLPRLVISVTGGAIDFNLPRNIEDDLKRGLRKAVEATDAWIVTGGTDCGIMKYVGQAISEIDKGKGSIARHRARPVIGIATFGILAARQRLKRGDNHIDIEDAEVLPTEECSRPVNIGLDNNHNVFFLLDDGSEGKFGREIALRSVFEKEMEETLYKSQARFGVDHGKVFETSVNIFSVLLVVEGGPGTLTTAEQAIYEGTPVVVMEGSGRAADVLAYAWRFLHDRNPEARHLSLAGLRQRIRKMDSKADSERIDEIQKRALDIVQAGNQVKIYSVSDRASFDDSSEEDATGMQEGLDHALLQSVLCAQKLQIHQDDDGVNSRAVAKFRLNHTSLYLSLIFNDTFEARRSLRLLQRQSRELGQFRKELQQDLKGALRWALLGARFDFIRMMCLPGQVNLYEFLYENDRQVLKELFTVENHALAKKHVTHLLGTSFKRSSSWRRRTSAPETMSLSIDMANQFIHKAILPNSTGATINFVGQPFNQRDLKFSNATPIKARRDHAFLDLLVWAILFGHSDELGAFFWQQGGNSTSNALFAAMLLRATSLAPALAKEQFANARAGMKQNAKEFEKRAMGVLDSCHNDDSNMALRILEVKARNLRGFSQTTVGKDCMSLAVAGKRTALLSHPAALSLMDQKWIGVIDQQTRSISVLMSTICPLLLFQRSIFVVGFTTELISTLSATHDGDDDDIAAHNPDNWSNYHRLKMFFSAPAVKFTLDCISHVLLLVFYTLMVLGDLSGDLSEIEIALLIWMIALTSDELSQGFSGGLTEWSRHSWNIVDFLGLSLYWIGFIVRNQTQAGVQSIEGAQFAFAIGVALFYLRTFRFYMGTSQLGPKIIMLARMGNDIKAFLALFLVFMLMYGVSSETLLRKSGTPDPVVSLNTFQRLTYRPWFQMLGELFLDDIQEDSTCVGPEDFQGCGYASLLPATTAVYLLAVNIVLVNLLIAMMGRTYNLVQQESMEVWYLQMHDLLDEYQEKSVLPTPLSLFETIYLNLSMLWKRLCHICGSNCNSKVAPNDREDKDAPVRDSRRLESFQEKHTERFLEKEKTALQLETETLDKVSDLTRQQQTHMLEIHTQLQRLELRVEESVSAHARRLENRIGELEDGLKNLQGSKNLSSGKRLVRMTSFEDTMNRVRSSNTQRKDIIGDFKEYSKPPDRLVPWKPSKKLLSEAYGGRVTIGADMELVYYFKHGRDVNDEPHYGASNLLVMFSSEEQYIKEGKPDELSTTRTHFGEEVIKDFVPTSSLSWDIMMTDYNPPDFTSPYVLFNAGDFPIDGVDYWADPCGAIKDDDFCAELRRQLSGTCPFDDEGRPLNPRGRTGIRGRGVLGRWGPNRAVNYVITRAKFDANEAQMERAGKRMLELLLCRRKDGRWVLPGRFQNDESIDPLLRNALGLEAKSMAESEALQEVEQKLLDARDVQKFFDWVVADDRDTDNAWVDFNFKLVEVNKPRERTDVFEIADDPSSGYKFEWVTVHKNLELTYSSHYSLIEALSNYKKAYW